MNRKGLKIYYIANIRPVLTYASPAWTSLISDHNMQRIIQIEKSYQVPAILASTSANTIMWYQNYFVLRITIRLVLVVTCLFTADQVLQ